MFLHVFRQLNNNHKDVLIVTIDTGVVIIALSKYHELATYVLNNLWIEYGTSNSRKWIPIYEYAKNLGEKRFSALRFWYAFSGCDTVSGFVGRGKNTCWVIWNLFPEATKTFTRFSSSIDVLHKEDMDVIQICLPAL